MANDKCDYWDKVAYISEELEKLDNTLTTELDYLTGLLDEA